MGWHDAVSVRRDCGREELIKSNRMAAGVRAKGQNLGQF
jgi:hypothetical protein